MDRVGACFLSLLAILLVTACDGDGGGTLPATRIVVFEASATSITRGDSVTLSWQVDNAGTSANAYSCSLSRFLEGQDPAPMEEFTCISGVTEVPQVPPTLDAITYQLNALKRPLDRDNPWIIERIVVRLLDPQPPGEILWVRQIDSTADDYVAGVAVDGGGFPVVAGRTYGGLGGTTSAGNTDAFLRRYSPNGTEEWTRQFGTSGWDYARGVTVDGNDDVVMIGNLGSCAVTRKYTPAGSEAWTRQPCLDDYAIAVVTDAANNVIAAVSTYDDYYGDYEVQLRSYTPTGGDRWTVKVDVGYDDWVQGITTGPDGNLIVVGTYEYDYGAFVRKLTPAGQLLWSDDYVVGDYAWARGVAVDRDGNVLVVGGYAVYDDDYVDGIFVRKLSPAGEPIWTREYSSTSNHYVGGVAVDVAGNVIVVGSTAGYLVQPPIGQRDVFVRKYDAAGEEVWTRQFGINASDWPRAVAVDTSGAIFVAGDTYGATTNNGFLAKLAK